MSLFGRFLISPGFTPEKATRIPNFARTGLRIFHFAQNEYIPGRALPFIPSGFHEDSFHVGMP